MSKFRAGTPATEADLRDEPSEQDHAAIRERHGATAQRPRERAPYQEPEEG